MARPPPERIVRALLNRYGQTYAEEIGIKLRDAPAALFQLICASILMIARSRASVAVEACRALFAAGWRTPRAMAAASWEERTRTLNRAGYARYDERTSTMLADTSRLLLDEYGGDLRRLREDAGRDPARERELLKDFKGIGDVGVDIFFREVQTVWSELVPFADRRALEAAAGLGLPRDPRALSELATGRDFPRLVAALVRTRLARDYDRIQREASNPPR